MLEIADAYKSGRILPANWPTEAKPETPSLDLVATLNVGQLTTNARSILAFVKAQCAGYKAENYSESNIAEAKRDKAELNTAAKKFNDRRLELERDFMKPFDDFKDTIGEICAEIKKASGLIDGVVKEVEEREKADKRKLLEEAWTALDCQLFDLSKIWNPSWLNKTTKNKDVVVEMTAKIEKVKADLVVLDRIGEPDAKAHYLSTLNLESALAEADCIKANRERLAAAEKARLEREASPRTPTPISTPASIPAPAARVAATQPSVETTSSAVAIAEPEILERTMRVRGTREQIIALGNWMNENNIDFEKL